MEENEKLEITDALLTAFIADELSGEIKEQISLWITDKTENKKRYERHKKAWEVVGSIQPKPVAVNVDKAWDSVLNRIDETDEKIIPLKPRSNKKTILSVAAMIVVLLGVFSILKLTQSSVENIVHFAEHAGVEDILSDGSIVTLNENTSLVYPKTFAENERRVTLQGEAFFDIERNEEKPFIIDLPNQAYVKVLGTSFNIKAMEEDSIMEVYVSTGKVEFGQGDNKVILVAGQKAKLNRITGELISEEPGNIGVKELFWMEEELVFDHVPLIEVVTILNLVFDTEVTLKCKNFRDSLIVSEHSKGESLSEILTIVAGAHELSLESAVMNNKTKFTLDCNEN